MKPMYSRRNFTCMFCREARTGNRWLISCYYDKCSGKGAECSKCRTDVRPIDWNERYVLSLIEHEEEYHSSVDVV